MPPPTVVPATQVIVQITPRIAASTIAVTATELATSSRRETGSDSNVSRYRRSSATTVIRIAQRTAKNASASGTIRLSISASMYFSIESSCVMPKASFKAPG